MSFGRLRSPAPPGERARPRDRGFVCRQVKLPHRAKMKTFFLLWRAKREWLAPAAGKPHRWGGFFFFFFFLFFFSSGA